VVARGIGRAMTGTTFPTTRMATKNAIVFIVQPRHGPFMQRKKAARSVASAGPPDIEGSVADRMRRCVEAAFEDAQSNSDLPSLPIGIVQACEMLVLQGAETCRLVALTVITATAADRDVPPQIIQAGAGGRDF
jgi:hypothetical protein